MLKQTVACNDSDADAQVAHRDSATDAMTVTLPAEWLMRPVVDVYDCHLPARVITVQVSRAHRHGDWQTNSESP
jgi:hypothetical protein